jgi:hypothetical protein
MNYPMKLLHCRTLNPIFLMSIDSLHDTNEILQNEVSSLYKNTSSLLEKNILHKKLISKFKMRSIQYRTLFPTLSRD